MESTLLSSTPPAGLGINGGGCGRPGVDRLHPISCATSPAILDPLEATIDALESLNFTDQNILPHDNKAVRLLDHRENILIGTEKQFVKALDIEPNTRMKVVAIFGNTGEGKSHTLNHAFFNGVEIFHTSSCQTSCTLGVSAKFNPKFGTLFLDTEGMLGVAAYENQRTRLLLKVLAIADVVIYRTKAERLQSDMYKFLGGASEAYRQHFSLALQQILQRNGVDRSASSLGPNLIIFHETRHTTPLRSTVSESAEDVIRRSFSELDLEYDGFSALKYVGIRSGDGITSFRELQNAVLKELECTEVRSAREAKYVYMMLKGLNEKFQSPITHAIPQMHLSAFFTCPDKCLSCKSGCTLSMGHKEDNEPHHSSNHCKHQHQYENVVYLCKACYSNGQKQVVDWRYASNADQAWTSVLSTVWSGDVLECPKCGIIYQSRQYWYGNRDPTEEAVVVEIVHVWPEDPCIFQNTNLFGSQHSAQKILDNVTTIRNAVASIGSSPAKMISDWVNDKIAPHYWKPNDQINVCHKCKKPLPINELKHHCRACGEGFCDGCSSRTQPVPEWGWTGNVRVCDTCYTTRHPGMDGVTTSLQHQQHQLRRQRGDDTEVRTRKIGETLMCSVSMVKSLLDIPKEYIKETARPRYWVPDQECVRCVVCAMEFGIATPLHHCRDCGKGVCDSCSTSRRAVPTRGWDRPVRVCDSCMK